MARNCRTDGGDFSLGVWRETEIVSATKSASSPAAPDANHEDIYRAVGIMSTGSEYGIHKVVDMLNNDRIRGLSRDAKRPSVLMALDAAGISAERVAYYRNPLSERAHILRDGRPEQTTGRF